MGRERCCHPRLRRSHGCGGLVEDIPLINPEPDFIGFDEQCIWRTLAALPRQLRLDHVPFPRHGSRVSEGIEGDDAHASRCSIKGGISLHVFLQVLKVLRACGFSHKRIVNESGKQGFVRTSGLCDSFADSQKTADYSKFHGFWMRFDKGSLSNIRKAVLSSSSHSSE